MQRRRDENRRATPQEQRFLRKQATHAPCLERAQPTTCCLQSCTRCMVRAWGGCPTGWSALPLRPAPPARPWTARPLPLQLEGVKGCPPPAHLAHSPFDLERFPRGVGSPVCPRGAHHGAPLVHAPLQLLVLALVLPAVTLRVRLLFPLLLLLLLLLLLRLRRRCDGAGLAANPIFTALRR